MRNAENGHHTGVIDRSSRGACISDPCAHSFLPFSLLLSFYCCFPVLSSADEKNYRSDMKTTFESGQRWEKVNKLISTAPRPNEKAGTSRVERMRKLLIQLKTEKKQ